MYLVVHLSSKLMERRINEFNLESILTLFLPYHESPHFAKMVTILHIKYVDILLSIQVFDFQ